MARAAAPSPSVAFVRWEEVQTTSDKGRKEIHYFLKRKDGTADLAVIGKEKSLRRISFRYSSGVMAGTHSLTLLKLKSRKEVVDWLNSMVSDSTSLRSSASPTSPLDDTECWQFDTKKLKDSQLQKLGHCTKEFLWLGSAWTCRKRRKHFESFLRNGVKISIHDFVFVLAERHRRLVAYLEDMYEDPRGNKMVVVRWFHKIDEVGIVLPHNFNDREIFFSLWLQDINIECIDGSAAVLDPQHYEKFLNDAADTQLVPFMCHRQYDNGALKPFDITQVKGYWEQEVLRYMYSSTSDASMKPLSSDDGFVINEKVNNPVVRSRNRPQQLSNGDDFFSENVGKKRGLEASYACGSGKDSNDACESASLCGKDLIFPNLLEHLVVGAHVEVLCQDSGLRGCWYRAIVAKKHKDKVKVRYQDIQDAENEANCLEEWLLASRVAISDRLKLRFFGRRIIRPSPQLHKSKVSWVIDVGCVVDVWWHDGWWEGVIIHKESEERYHVYFPGEKLKSVFGRDDLRHSQEWLGNRWEHVRRRPDVVNLILSSLEETKISIGGEDVKSPEAGGAHQLAEVAIDTDKDNLFFTDVNKCNRLLLNTADDKGSKLPVLDLSKDHILGQLKWNPLRKRKRGSGGYMQKSNARITGSLRKPGVVGSRTCDGFLIPKSLKVDHENCKYIGKSPFTSSVVPTLTNLVMSQ